MTLNPDSSLSHRALDAMWVAACCGQLSLRDASGTGLLRNRSSPLIPGALLSSPWMLGSCVPCVLWYLCVCMSKLFSQQPGISEALAVLAVSLSLLKPSSSSPRRAKIHRTLCSSRRMVGSRSGWKCCWNGQQWVVPQFFSGVFLGTME